MVVGHTLVAVGSKSKGNRRTSCSVTVATFVVSGIPANVALPRRVLDYVRDVQLQGGYDALKGRGME